MIKQADIHINICTVLKRISKAALAAGRDPNEVQLVAVGKTQTVESIGHAIASGARIVGENYIQEAREKFDALFQSNVQWHFIGRLQSNKAKYAVRMFDLIHSVGTLKLAQELNKQARKAGKKQQILVQVNVSGESSKSGIELRDAAKLVQEILPFENLHLRGLMTMPPFFDAPEKARPYFSALRRLRDRMRDQLGVELPDLSMGMTGDFEVAIEEGASLVRIGTALFGERQ
jgi:pyridoxal phosphate enzyme (YggS family)